MKSFVITHRDDLVPGFDFPVERVGVGNHGAFKDGIVCRDLPVNIENRNRLVAYTAWYALVHNGFIQDNEFYLILEYDVELSKDFLETVTPYIRPGVVIGFKRRSIGEAVFFGSRIMDLMIHSIKEVYQVDSWSVVEKEIYRNRDLWCPTSNCIIQGKDMISYVNWFDKLLPFYIRQAGAAHYHERALRIWMGINDLEPVCVDNVLKHGDKLSHGIRFPMMRR